MFLPCTEGGGEGMYATTRLVNLLVIADKKCKNKSIPTLVYKNLFRFLVAGFDPEVGK